MWHLSINFLHFWSPNSHCQMWLTKNDLSIAELSRCEVLCVPRVRYKVTVAVLTSEQEKMPVTLSTWVLRISVSISLQKCGETIYPSGYYRQTWDRVHKAPRINPNTGECLINEGQVFAISGKLAHCCICFPGWSESAPINNHAPGKSKLTSV